jgi:two-component system, OmpR family, alkaline phosphatase synthesis response regulator PhoP
MENSEYTVLIVDDEPDIQEFLSYNLKKEGYKVFSVTNGRDAIEVAKQITPQLILLDVMMPEMDGIETCEELRRVPALRSAIIAFLTARGEDYTQIAAFEAGGDDFITKPIKPKVLMSRIRALMKRYRNTIEEMAFEEDTIIRKKTFTIDKEKFIVIKENGDEITLPKKEFELLNLLISKPEKVFTRDEIFQLIWGDNIFVGDRTIDVHVRKLREKLGENHIRTIKGVGYKYTD